MRGRRRPSGAPGEARRIDFFEGKLPVTVFACPSFLPAPLNYSQFHLVTLLGPPPNVTVDKNGRAEAAGGAGGEAGRGGEVIFTRLSVHHCRLSCVQYGGENLLVLNYIL